MADIPVEKRSGTPWWLWLIGLLVLIALIWLLISLFNDDDDIDEDELGTADTTEQMQTNGVAAGAAGAGVITSIATILDAEDPQQLAGREVRLDNMRVTSVLGDSAFYASPQDEDRRLLVALNEVIPTPPPGTEGRYDVTEGQVMTINGGLRALTREADAWDLSQEQAQAMQDDQVYVRAQELTITEEAGQS